MAHIGLKRIAARALPCAILAAAALAATEVSAQTSAARIYESVASGRRDLAGLSRSELEAYASVVASSRASDRCRANRGVAQQARQSLHDGSLRLVQCAANESLGFDCAPEQARTAAAQRAYAGALKAVAATCR